MCWPTVGQTGETVTFHCRECGQRLLRLQWQVGRGVFWVGGPIYNHGGMGLRVVADEMGGDYTGQEIAGPRPIPLVCPGTRCDFVEWFTVEQLYDLYDIGCRKHKRNKVTV
jgi:hypothetical protein